MGYGDGNFTDSAQNPLTGLDSSDYQGFGSGGNQSSPFGDMSLGSAGALGIGALGLGSILAQGPGPLPAQFGQLQSGVPGLRSEAQLLEGQGAGLVGQGQQALAMGQAGILTAPQQAQLKQYSSGLTNQARQMYYSMGRNPDQDTSFIGATADIDSKVNAMAQSQIQSTIQLGLGEISGGSSLSSQGLGFENAANQILLQAGQAQLQADKSYSDSLTNVFGSIAKMLPAVLAL
jgi:hypothetical protein